MRRRTLPIAVLIGLAVFAPSSRASDCARTSTGMIPLTDLGSGIYQGFEGGLYSDGSNHRPSLHNAAGIAIANTIVPIDTMGAPDPVAGRVVLISIGMSNCTQEFSAFVPKAMNDPARNPRLQVIDCAEGGQSADRIDTPGAPYWDHVLMRLRNAGSSPLQPQAVWIKEANAGPTGAFPASADTLTRNLGAIVRIIRQKLPSVRLVYFTSRIYAGYATSSLNPEPYAYESGFAVKWLIGAQIAGEDSLNYDPGSGPVEAPWMAWGPYLWADGLTPRSDGLTWRCDEFADDGTHPATSGREVVADSLLAFFERDETTAPWFVRSATAAVPRAPSTNLRLIVAPNPENVAVTITFSTVPGRAWRLDVLDLFGRRVRDMGFGSGTGVVETRTWDVSDGHGVHVPAGLYWVRLMTDGRQLARRLAVLQNN